MLTCSYRRAGDFPSRKMCDAFAKKNGRKNVVKEIGTKIPAIDERYQTEVRWRCSLALLWRGMVGTDKYRVGTKTVLKRR